MCIVFQLNPCPAFLIDKQFIKEQLLFDNQDVSNISPKEKVNSLSGGIANLRRNALQPHHFSLFPHTQGGLDLSPGVYNY